MWLSERGGYESNRIGKGSENKYGGDSIADTALVVNSEKNESSLVRECGRVYEKRKLNVDVEKS